MCARRNWRPRITARLDDCSWVPESDGVAGCRFRHRLSSPRRDGHVRWRWWPCRRRARSGRPANRRKRQRAPKDDCDRLPSSTTPTAGVGVFREHTPHTHTHTRTLIADPPKLTPAAYTARTQRGVTPPPLSPTDRRTVHRRHRSAVRRRLYDLEYYYYITYYIIWTRYIDVLRLI